MAARPSKNSDRFRQTLSIVYASATRPGSRVFHASSAIRAFCAALSIVKGGSGGRLIGAPLSIAFKRVESNHSERLSECLLRARADIRANVGWMCSTPECERSIRPDEMSDDDRAWTNILALYSFQDQKFFLHAMWMLERRSGFLFAHTA